MKAITFTFTDPNVSNKYAPTPASSNIPEWYKNLESYINGKKIPTGDGNVSITIKKCMPVFDAMTSGYLLYSHSDIYIEPIEDGFNYQWANKIIEFHNIHQAPTHPKSNGFAYPKFINAWAIKTPPGYSCLFINPLHRKNDFTILEGIVDTDSYNIPVNFPFVMNDPKFEGYIPAGTPIAQVIPIKREMWQMNINDDIKEMNQQHKNLTSVFFNRYKQMFWHRKMYK